MTKKKKRAIDLYVNIVLVILTIFAVLWMYFFGNDADLNAKGVAIFKYFTVDSNILLAIASAFVAIYRINRRKYDLGKALYTFKFTSIISVAVTFLVVIFILVPFGYSAKAMFCGPNFILHIVNPLVAMVSFVLFEYDSTISRKVFAHGILPSVLYSIVILPLVKINYIESPYPFMDINNNSLIESFITFVIMMISIGVISYMFRFANEKFND